MKKNLIVIAVILIILAVGGYFVFSRGTQEDITPSEEQEITEGVPAQISGSFRKGQPAPDFTLIDFDGSSHKISDFMGKAVVLDFWAAWCPFCVNEMPELQAAQDKYGDALIMIGVHRTNTESLSKGKEFAEDRGVSYLLVYDSDDSLYKAAGGFGMPVTVFIDKNGIVSETKSGPKTKEEIEEKVSNLLN